MKESLSSTSFLGGLAPKRVLLLLILRWTTTMTNAQWFPITTSTTSSLCGDLVATLDYYFDPSYQACQKCPTNQYADIENLDGNGNPWRCVCKPGFQATFNSCYDDSTGTCQALTCTDCISSGNSTTSDNSECMTCDTGVSVGADGHCACPSVGGFPQVIVDKDVVGNNRLQSSCASCPSGQMVIQTSATYGGRSYVADRYSCQSCPDENMEFTTSGSAFACTCKTGYEITGDPLIGEQSCVSSNLYNEYFSAQDSSVNVRYNSIGAIVISRTLTHFFIKSASLCKFYGGARNSRDCQALANLCVLQLYTLTSTGTSTSGGGACVAFNAIVGVRPTDSIIYSQPEWRAGLPWIYYGDTGSAPCFAKNITAVPINLKETVMQYVVSKYSLNGTFLGNEDVSDLFHYCQTSAPTTQSVDTTWTIFGNSKIIRMKCDLYSILSKSLDQQYFYELFIRESGTGSLFSVPVRITQLVDDTGGTPNDLYPRNLCDSTDVLVRRFFLFDIVSGIDAAEQQTAPKYIRYAQHMILAMNIRTDNPEKVYSPVLTISYNEKISADIVAPSYDASGTYQREDDAYIFQSVYSQSMDKFQNELYGVFVFCTVLFSMLVMLRWYNLTIKKSRIFTIQTQRNFQTDYYYYYEVACLMCHSFNVIFFPFVVLVCWYWFVFFKLQDVSSVMLPPMYDIYQSWSNEDGSYSYSSYYWFGVFVNMMWGYQFLYIIDMIWRQANADIFFLDWEPQSDSKKGKHVSVWRTILVANEWSELMTVRRTSIEFTLFWIAFFLFGLGLDNNATHQPDLNNTEDGTINIVLRFANTTWWWAILSLAQWLWKICIAERYLGEPPEQVFVDFCTIAKISVLCLEGEYDGYYLHCRSPHPYSDGSMEELVDMLHYEESGLTTDRSLSGGPAEVQSFNIYVSGEWRLKYDEIYSNMTSLTTVNEVLSSGRILNRNNIMARFFGPTAQPTKQSMSAWKKMTKFLQDFVENEAKRTIITNQSFFEKLLLQPPALAISNQPSIFIPDPHFQYCRLLFLGRETDLLLFNILTYSVVDLWFSNTAASILITYLLNFAITWFRQSLGQANIAKKTLIDERFLI